ncbi:hypothetical protein COU01_00340 [Candidatus Falkowbacteria bacterium CG10_big_fil_rev_8_21_14_0_10_44_15]|uniref:DNA-binding transcriptional regulator n=1 Tax=Candidatus Falkowbacteria bacterium CG10_big_fil_rev_8_21_14_0_10_44_15 TaxID=1974569 RepID=A0A2H0V0X2_9BACT|nr:MAG: hypothetical protein COU01_00340 [Candidatus Falkowbacteria bacterium CG10_big_fil_rev_8_21_14_0_10_44_15]
MEKWDNKNTNDLIVALLSLKNTTDMKRFLRDLLTENEIVEFGKRWQTAQLLNANIPYTSIVKKTGLSSTTVARISKWLKNGTGGYRVALNKTHHHTHQNGALP